PEGANGVGAAAVDARIRGALRAHQGAAGRRPAGGSGHAPRADERGRRDCGRRCCRRPVVDRGTGPQRRGGPDGPALPAGRDCAVVTVVAAAAIGSVLADLEISRAWLVDPALGREGPGEIVVTDGILE